MASTKLKTEEISLMTKITIFQLQLSQDPYQEVQEAFQPNPTGKKP